MKNEIIDHKIKEMVKSLDDVYPAGLPGPDIIWTSLVNKRTQRRFRRVRVVWTMAASFIALVISALAWLNISENHNTSVTGNQTTHLSLDFVAMEENDVSVFVSFLCNEKNTVCTSAEFKELQNELHQSASLLSEIKKQISVFGDDDDLSRARTRIEDHQVKIIKEMIQMI